ncbi:YhhN-like protein-domain-containing protein [Aspergillus tetrazonus]
METGTTFQLPPFPAPQLLLFSLPFLDFQKEQSQKDTTSKRDQNQDVSVSFEAGVVAFAAAHIAYTYAFLQRAQAIAWPTFVTTFAATVINFLGLKISRDMKPLVLVYALIISSMFAVATSVSDSFMISQRAAGAAMFVVSDVFVAASAFGTTSVGSRGLRRIAVGYGLYFWGQMICGRVSTKWRKALQQFMPDAGLKSQC